MLLNSVTAFLIMLPNPEQWTSRSGIKRLVLLDIIEKFSYIHCLYIPSVNNLRAFFCTNSQWLLMAEIVEFIAD